MKLFPHNFGEPHNRAANLPDGCCLILNAALQVHFLTEYRKKEPCYSC